MDKTAPDTTPKHTNRLTNERSPYLLQHANNPVDWYPWSDEALARARQEDKPILLSIGYSACHWCHVMERESFEDEEIAHLMNGHFVCIKVDREERPDLDELYMTAVQVLTGSGGWPLNVFLTPELKPFFGGTYFPPQDMWGRPGFSSVLRAVARTYAERRGQVEASAEQIAQGLAEASSATVAPGALEYELIARAVEELKQDFDPEWGGFGRAPKFPPSAALSVLLRHYAQTGDDEALRVVTVTLDRMARGGVYDQLGGGFHRYAVDREWLAPHFEKMLYDNALLVVSYLEGYQVTGQAWYAQVARETLDYVLREMTDEAGGFHSTQDADSEGEEGTYYLWAREEVERVLGADAALFCDYYDVTAKGNFEHRNILHVPTPPERFAEEGSLSVAELQKALRAARQELLAHRERRVPPGKDDKVLADWNGLMISAFARAYQVVGDERYRAAADRAGRFILGAMRPEGRLRHAYRAGQSYIEAMLDDHAFLLQALIDLYETTFDVSWIEAAEEIAGEMIDRFGDPSAGGFYLAPPGQSDLIVRGKRTQDSATPSGNSVAAHALLRLNRLTGVAVYREQAARALRFAAAEAQPMPRAFAGLLCALDLYLSPPRDIVVVGPEGSSHTQDLLEAVWRRYLPNRTMALVDPTTEEASRAEKAMPLTASKPMSDGRATAYVCLERGCLPPVTSAEELAGMLAEVGRRGGRG